MAKDRRAMVNPFAGITTKAPAPAEAPTAEAQAVEVAERSSPPTAPQPEPRERVQRAVDAREYLGFRLPTSLADRARAAAWTQRQSLTAYVEAALEAAVTAAEHQNGGPFPPVARRARGA